MLWEFQKHPRDRVFGQALLQKHSVVNLDDDPRDIQDGVVHGQVIHLVKAARDTVIWKDNRRKKVSVSYDRLAYIRDCETGIVFAVFSSNIEMSRRMFWVDVRIGSYVALLRPGRPMNETLRQVPILEYDDYLWPIERPADQILCESVPKEGAMSSFCIHVSLANFSYSQLRFIERKCSGENCDGQLDTCICVGTQCKSKYTLSLRLELDVDGARDNVFEFSSHSFTANFIDRRILEHPKKKELVDMVDIIPNKINSVTDGFLVSGWVSAGSKVADEGHDIQLSAGVHISSIELMGPVHAGIWTRARRVTGTGGGGGGGGGDGGGDGGGGGGVGVGVSVVTTSSTTGTTASSVSSNTLLSASSTSGVTNVLSRQARVVATRSATTRATLNATSESRSVNSNDGDSN